MIKLAATLLLGILVGVFATKAYEKPIVEAKLNTANVIRSAWEFRRLSESLASGVETRCHIALLADAKADDLMKAAEALEHLPSAGSDTEMFALKSVLDALEIFQRNGIVEIAEECRSSTNA